MMDAERRKALIAVSEDFARLYVAYAEALVKQGVDPLEAHEVAERVAIRLVLFEDTKPKDPWEL